MENPQNQQITTETNNKVKPPRKGFLNARIMIAFLLGATTYALFNMGYGLFAQELQAEKIAVAVVQEIANTDGQTQADSTFKPSSQVGESVSSEEFANYVESKNCITYAPEYARYVKSHVYVTVEDVDIYEGLKYRANANKALDSISWDTLPKVVDHECKPIDITKIKVGDRVNVYTAPRTSGELQKYLIQRAVK